MFGSWAEVGAAGTGHTAAAEEGLAGSIVAGEAVVVGDSRRAAGEKAGLAGSRRKRVAVYRGSLVSGQCLQQRREEAS